MSFTPADLPVVVIGAGPVGLAAAAHLAERGQDFVVLESGPSVAAAIDEWRHVKLFSPWRYDIDTAARRLLQQAGGWTEPDPGVLPTGGDLIDSYLAPLAKTAAAEPTRSDTTPPWSPSPGSGSTGSAPPAARTRRSSSGWPTASELLASAVIDAAGTWRRPNVLGGSGIPARGEAAAAARIIAARTAGRSGPRPGPVRRTPDRGRRRRTLGRHHTAGPRRTGRAGARHRGRLGRARRRPGPHLRRRRRRRTPRPRRPRHPACRTSSGPAGSNWSAASGSRPSTRPPTAASNWSPAQRRVVADTVVNATGFRPDHGIVGELRLDLDPILGSTRALAPLIDPNQHSCGTVPPHGVDELAHPEPGYYAVGAKSYGRAPTFLLATGYEQARSVVAALAGDWDAARDVQLDLPETGVCSSNLADGDVDAMKPLVAAAARRRRRSSSPLRPGVAWRPASPVACSPCVDDQAHRPSSGLLQLMPTARRSPLPPDRVRGGGRSGVPRPPWSPRWRSPRPSATASSTTRSARCSAR